MHLARALLGLREGRNQSLWQSRAFVASTLLTKGSGDGEFPKFNGGRDTQSLIQAAKV